MIVGLPVDGDTPVDPHSSLNLREGYQTDGLFDIGMNHIKDRSEDRPFSMIISVEPPHDPFEAPEDLQTAWENRDITLPDNFDVEDPEARARFILHRKRYNAMVENLDQNMGRLRLRLLRQAP